MINRPSMINDDQRDANQNPTQFSPVPNQNETNAVDSTSLSRFVRQRLFADFEPPFLREGVGVKVGKSRLSSEHLVVP